ncbi:MAG TPA: PPK2 family polyphosphate kinase [Thermoplasmata archaeon]|nr:PPK2 family polyphosphate kinase [Thermoplasmata archaeon]
MHPWKRYRVRPGRKVRLERCDPAERDGELARTDKAAKATLARLLPKIDRLQALLWAERRHRLLVVLQGMDTAGKDATIRRVFEGVNPQGVRVARFGPPTEVESAHDFLWRVHPKTPAAGEIVIFNRSHYEDVLWPRVHGTIDAREVERRLEAIRDFERLLTEEGATVLKFFLNIDRAEQKRRLEARLQDPAKHWKFSVHDLAERPRWPKYQRAYEELLAKTSTADAPWFVVPSNHPLSRDVVVAAILHRALDRLPMRYPPLAPDVGRQLRSLGWRLPSSTAGRSSQR